MLGPGAGPADERAAPHAAGPLQAMVFSTFPEIPVNLSCLSCQPKQCRRLHFDSCSWKIQLPPSSSSPFHPPPTCLKKNNMREEGPSYSSSPGPPTPTGRLGRSLRKGHGPFLAPKAPRAAGNGCSCLQHFKPEAGTLTAGRDVQAGTTSHQEQVRKRRVMREAGWPGKAGSDPDLDSCILQET